MSVGESVHSSVRSSDFIVPVVGSKVKSFNTIHVSVNNLSIWLSTGSKNCKRMSFFRFHFQNTLKSDDENVECSLYREWLDQDESRSLFLRVDCHETMFSVSNFSFWRYKRNGTQFSVERPIVGSLSNTLHLTGNCSYTRCTVCSISCEVKTILPDLTSSSSFSVFYD